MTAEEPGEEKIVRIPRLVETADIVLLGKSGLKKVVWQVQAG